MVPTVSAHNFEHWPSKKRKKKAGILKMLQGSYILAALKKVYVFLYVILIV